MRWRWIAIGSVLLGLGYALLPTRGTIVGIASVEARGLRVPVLCSGSLEPPPGGEIRSEDGGRVLELPAKEGQHVKAGDVLLRLDNTAVDTELIAAEQELSSLNSEAKAASAELAKATGEQEAKRAIVDEDRRLLEKEAVSRASYETDRLALKTAEAGVDAARARVESLAEAPRTRLGLARARAEGLRRQREALLVRAPRDGVVYGLPRRVGEEVHGGDVVANVTDPDRPRLRARVDEPDLPRVKEGQSLLVTFDGLPDRSFEGRLTGVAPSLRAYAGREVGEVLGELSDPRHELPLNASVNVEIIVGERAKALVIPRNALRRDGPTHYVFLLKEGRAERREVTLGLVGLAEVEVVGGLQAGDKVILPGSSPLAEGKRVVVR